jgi:hypothetical protein
MALDSTSTMLSASSIMTFFFSLNDVRPRD